MTRSLRRPETTAFALTGRLESTNVEELVQPSRWLTLILYNEALIPI